MTEILPAISSLGFPVAITTFLLYDYSKKIALIQAELVRTTEKLDYMSDQLQRIESKVNGN